MTLSETPGAPDLPRDRLRHLERAGTMSVNESNLRRLKELPLCFLMTFGHCGVDWLHSLLDYHPQILMMPAFSFYRSWGFINADEAINAEEMCQLWRSYILEREGMQHIRRKLLYSKEEEALFFDTFKELLLKYGISQLAVFWAIHESFRISKKICIENVDVIVVQEHLPFYFEKIMDSFQNLKILMVIRDPRAAFGGSFKWLEDRFGYLPDYYYNFIP